MATNANNSNSPSAAGVDASLDTSIEQQHRIAGGVGWWEDGEGVAVGALVQPSQFVQTVKTAMQSKGWFKVKSKIFPFDEFESLNNLAAPTTQTSASTSPVVKPSTFSPSTMDAISVNPSPNTCLNIGSGFLSPEAIAARIKVCQCNPMVCLIFIHRLPFHSGKRIARAAMVLSIV
jgi:hypothetical protein